MGLCGYSLTMTPKQHSNPNLVPTVVTDKNGRMTTVHRKADSASSNGAASIPPASLPKTNIMSEYLSGMEALSASLTVVGHRLRILMQETKIHKKIKATMLAELHDGTLSLIDHSVLGNDAKAQKELLDSCLRQRTLVPLNNAAVVADVAAECDDLHRSVFTTYVDGLQMYRLYKDPLIDWSSKSADEQEVPKALVRAAIGLKKPYSQVNAWVDGKPRHINSEGLTELIMKRPQDVQRIVDLVNLRELPVDTEQDIANLEGLLDQDIEDPLSSGLL